MTEYESSHAAFDLAKVADGIVEWRKRVEKIQANNDARIGAMAKDGAMVDPVGLLKTRVIRLTEELLGDMDSEGRLVFEEKLAEEYERDLRAAEGEVRRAILLRGVNGRSTG